MFEHLMDYVKVNDRYYYVSTNYTFDNGLETMIFETDKNNRVIDWMELYAEHYSSENEAVEGHRYAVENVEECIENYDGSWRPFSNLFNFDIEDDEEE